MQRNKKTILTISVILMITVGVIWNEGRKKFMDNKVLGEAEIVVYKKEEKIVLDPKSPYFKELQAACEELIINSFRESLPCEEIEKSLSFEEIKELKNKEHAIELIYKELISQDKLGFAEDLTRFIDISQVIIPLSGKLTHFKLKSENSQFVALLLFIPISLPDGKIKMEIWGLKDCLLVGSKGPLQKIKNILTNKFDIPIP